MSKPPSQVRGACFVPNRSFYSIPFLGDRFGTSVYGAT
jgi:hypothetical protein